MATAPTPPSGAALSHYSELFGSDAFDPHNNDSEGYASLLASFRTNNRAPSNAHLNRYVGDAQSDYPQAFVRVVKDTIGGPCYEVVHAVVRYPTLMGRPTAWDGRLFAFSGDVFEGLISTVEFPAAAFEIANTGNAVNVPATIARALELLAAEPTDQALKLLADGQAQIRGVTVRYMIPLPHAYVPLLFGRRRTIRSGFAAVAQLIEQRGDAVNLPHMVEWFLGSLMLAADGTSVLTGNPLIIPQADMSLNRHRRGVLVAHLPGLARPPVEPGSAIQAQMAAHMYDLVEESRRTREEAARHADKQSAPRSVAKYFGEAGANTLCILCNVDYSEELPPVWAALAANSRHDRSTLERFISDRSHEAKLDRGCPVVSPELVKKLLSLEWSGMNSDDLSAGIQPFALILPDSADGHGAQEMAASYDLLMEASTTTQLTDVQKLRQSKVRVPLNHQEAGAQLTAALLVWVTVLGTEHPFAVSLAAMVTEFVTSAYHYGNRIDQIPSEKITHGVPRPALLLRYVQLRSVMYWRTAKSQRRLPVTPPDFAEVLRKIDIQDHSWIPTIPTKYWSRVQNPGVPRLNPMVEWFSQLSQLTGGHSSDGSSFTPTPIAPATGSAGGGSSGNGGSGGSQNPGPTRERQTKQTNPGISQILQPFKDKATAGTIRDAIARGGGPSKVSRNGVEIPMCVSYHLRGECWSGCSRAADHGPHSVEEDTALAAWCQGAYA